MADAKKLTSIREREKELLLSPARPIVLLEIIGGCPQFTHFPAEAQRKTK
ncbi:MAG: hypothetical protein KAI69_00330 [Deltaproteobacteria bacterium]|nr:hypothetical protein [Deltaproteobacteria bacterium]